MPTPNIPPAQLSAIRNELRGDMQHYVDQRLNAMEERQRREARWAEEDRQRRRKWAEQDDRLIADMRSLFRGWERRMMLYITVGFGGPLIFLIIERFS